MIGSDIFISKDYSNPSIYPNGLTNYDYEVLLHEIGHALGLKHPFESDRDNVSILNPYEDQTKFTAMSYNESQVTFSGTFRSLDWMTLTKFYGVNSEFRSGDDIYAFKPDYLLTEKNSDANINYAMQAGKILGASHVTLELPRNSSHTLKLGQMAKKNGIYVAYHGHEQQNPTWWDTALNQSSFNAMNLDLGHYTAAGNTDSIDLIQNKNQNIMSMHVKDRQNPANGKKNVSFGKGDTPIKEVLQLMRDNKYNFTATIEYEYETPADSSIINEIKKSVAYCKNALES